MRPPRRGVVGAVLPIAVGKQVISLWVGDQVHPSYTMLAGFGAWSVLNGIMTGLSSFVLGTGGGRANAFSGSPHFCFLFLCKSSFFRVFSASLVFLVGDGDRGRARVSPPRRALLPHGGLVNGTRADERV